MFVSVVTVGSAVKRAVRARARSALRYWCFSMESIGSPAGRLGRSRPSAQTVPPGHSSEPPMRESHHVYRWLPLQSWVPARPVSVYPHVRRGGLVRGTETLIQVTSRRPNSNPSVPCCLSRKALQLWFSRGEKIPDDPKPKLALSPLRKHSKFSKSALRAGWTE